MKYPKLDISQVDFNDADDVEGFAMLIFAIVNRLQLFMPSIADTPEKAELLKSAKLWVCNVEESIDSLSVGESLAIIILYDLIHRIAFNRPARQQYIDKYKLKAFDAYIHGDTTVNQYALQRAVKHEIRRRNRAFIDKPLQWECLCIDRWHKQFQYGRCLENICDYDTIQRVKSLLDSDLWAFEARNEVSFKQKLFANHRHYFDKVEDFDLKTLIVLENFLGSSVRYLTTDEFSMYEESIYHSILSRPEANCYLKTSIKLRLEDNVIRSKNLTSA